MKIKEEELKTIPEQTNKPNELVHNIGLLESQKHGLLHDIAGINKDIEELNNLPDTDKNLRSQVRKRQFRIVNLIEKELKIVTKNHYRNTWIALGMAAFGIPFGVALGASLGNMAFIGIGLPIGMALGMALGSTMDKKAFDEGRQLDLELNS